MLRKTSTESLGRLRKVVTIKYPPGRDGNESPQRLLSTDSSKGTAWKCESSCPPAPRSDSGGKAWFHQHRPIHDSEDVWSHSQPTLAEQAYMTRARPAVGFAHSQIDGRVNPPNKNTNHPMLRSYCPWSLGNPEGRLEPDRLLNWRGGCRRDSAKDLAARRQTFYLGGTLPSEKRPMQWTTGQAASDKADGCFRVATLAPTGWDGFRSRLPSQRLQTPSLLL